MVQMNLFAGQEYRRRGRIQTWTWGGEGEGGMNWKIGNDIYILLLLLLSRFSRV